MLLTGVACKNDWESVDHLLLCCSYAYDLWTFVFSLFVISWVMLKQAVELLVFWHRGAGQHQAATVWWGYSSVLCGLLGGYRTTKLSKGRSVLS